MTGKGIEGDEGRDQGLIVVFNKLITSAECYCIQRTTLVHTSLAANTVMGNGLSSQLPLRVQSSLHGQAGQSPPLNWKSGSQLTRAYGTEPSTTSDRIQS